MKSIAEGLADPVLRRAVVRDAALLVDAEVASKRGLRGRALQAGFSAFRAVKPGIMEEAVDKLLPHFAPVIDPFWAQASESDDPVRWMSQRDGQIADALLGVTDRLAESAQHRVLKKIYGSLRGQARGHVVDAIPGLARLMVKHAS